MLRIALLVLTALFAACGRTNPPPRVASAPPRLLVVGWDGASFRAIDPLLAEGKLPHLAALLARGSRAPLESTRIPISSAAWTTATTGKGPGEHGVFAFQAPRAHEYELELVSARSIRAAPLWRLLSGRGIPSLVFGVPLTYPPEPILGTMVCGMLAPSGAEYTWPREFASSLRARGYLPDLDPWLEEREPTLEEALHQLDVREAVLDELLGRDDWRLAWIVFKELDVLSHFSYGAELTASVRPLYERLDRLLGALVARVGDDTNVILLSDHGFTSYARGFNLHAWLVAEGFATRNALDSAPLPEGPFARRFAEEAAQRLAELDLARSAAFAFACEGNFGSVRLNLAGREPRGIVTPEAIDNVLARLEARLRAHPSVREVWRASTLLPGTERQALPDLVFEALPEVQVFAERGSELEGRYEPLVADHELLGIFVAAGPALASGAKLDGLTLLDVAPLALHLLGQPVPNEMRGRVPVELLRAAHEITRVPEASFGTLTRVDSGSPYTEAEIRALEQNLRALGYGD
jgi:predicted AlkP superfamily phosphohydrolase/phosphomutase